MKKNTKKTQSKTKPTAKQAPAKKVAVNATKSLSPKKAMKALADSAKKTVKTAIKDVKKTVKAVEKSAKKTAPAKAAAVKATASKTTNVVEINAKNTKAAKGTAPAAPKMTAKQARAAAAEALRNAMCKEVACELMATTKSFCRLHYIKNWKRIQQKEMILKEKKLNLYIEELVSKYPDKYIEAIRQDLHSEKDFAKVIADLEIEEDMDDFIDAENDAIESVIEPVARGRDFEDDDGETF